MSVNAIAEAFIERTMSLEEWAALDEDEPGEVVARGEQPVFAGARGG
jgi:hypothetical protein